MNSTISHRCSSLVSSTTLCSSSASSPINSNSVYAEEGMKKKTGDDTRPTQSLTRSDSKAATTTASTATAPAAATPRTSTTTTTTAKRSAKAAAPSPEPKLKLRTTKAPSLVKLLKRRDFGTIRHMLLDSTVDVNSSWFSREYTIMGENCLHYLLRFRPDSQTVSAMIYRLRLSGFQEPELSVDLTGRTPLHVAVFHGCDVSVIDTLLKANAGHISSRAQDVNGRVPLHYAIMMSTSPSTKTKTDSAFGFSPRGTNVENEDQKQTIRPVFPFPFLFMMKRRNKKNDPQCKKEWMYNILHTVMLLLGMSPETCLIMDDYHQLPVDVVDTFLHVHQEMSPSSSSNSMERLGGRGRTRNLWKSRSSTNNGNDNKTLNEQDELHKRIVSMIGDELRMSYELYTGTTPCRRISSLREKCCCCCNSNSNVHRQQPHQPVVDPKLSMDVVVFSSADSAGGFENDDDISVLSTRF
eukprot:CAMPEP_0113492074 /NCGR_PEP_ID=MMETSP0014_2-20120614/27883_1 /TAXON_ID=2857 /ORGANISM="Nitzschia sp." /LENGTH=466 /DNA_ID=CAMNT_0000385883 /DNA_START=130 /DNA_END=1530 /DNA_ORIENTATION=+ /assembly_acc=CAM_ASM_000159